MWRSIFLLRFTALSFGIVLLGVGCQEVSAPKPPSDTLPDASPRSERTPVSSDDDTQEIALGNLPGVHPAFAVTPSLPARWKAEVVPEIEAVNLYDPTIPGSSPREQSQIFLRHFKANDFFTLGTVTIHKRTPTTVTGRPAVTYIIEKKPRAADFPEQPSWRNVRHRVTDVRLSDDRPSEFLVIAQNPALPDPVFDRVLFSLKTTEDSSAGLVFPAKGFTAAVTVKPFGLFVTPETSPVKPERFRGFHNAADAELPANTPVYAMVDGSVAESGVFDGYGGMLAIEHFVDGQRLIGIYGHLDPAQLPYVGTRVRGGEQIGILGDGFSSETDNERPHLHVGLYTGSGLSIGGYAPTREALSDWIDPVKFLQDHNAAEPH